MKPFYETIPMQKEREIRESEIKSKTVIDEGCGMTYILNTDGSISLYWLGKFSHRIFTHENSGNSRKKIAEFLLTHSKSSTIKESGK